MGTIVGSAVFNILAVAGICGVAAQTVIIRMFLRSIQYSLYHDYCLQALPLEWYPLTRDCVFYCISVVLLIVVLTNGRVYWYEALILVIAYLVYIFGEYKFRENFKIWD